MSFSKYLGIPSSGFKNRTEKTYCFMFLFMLKSPETERRSGGAKKLNIQSCHSPPKFWIMVSSPLNIARLEIKGQMPTFRLSRTSDKRARKSTSSIPSMVWQHRRITMSKP